MTKQEQIDTLVFALVRIKRMHKENNFSLVVPFCDHVLGMTGNSENAKQSEYLLGHEKEST